MFYVLAKLFELLFMPSNLLFFLALAAAICLAAGRENWGRRLALITAGVFVIFAAAPCGVWLARPLENLYPQAALPAHIDGIVVLGGGFDDGMFASRGAPGPSIAEHRLVSGYVLARRHPEAKLVFSGDPSEARMAVIEFTGLGLDRTRLTLEGHSRDTFENLRNAKALLQPKPGEVWVLVTAATHMPRAMAIARRLHWAVIAWPSDYFSARSGGGTWLDCANNLKASDVALHEWIGLIAYRLAGRAA